MAEQCPAPAVVNPLRESHLVAEDYHNRQIAAVNDHEIRLSVMTEGFAWHSHPQSDETFLVIDGELVIEFEDREVVLGAGDMFTVHKGVVHRTRPGGSRSVNLTFREARRANDIRLTTESTMKTLIVLAHPESQSFCAELARRAVVRMRLAGEVQSSTCTPRGLIG